jgi:hypothetical protein
MIGEPWYLEIGFVLRFFTKPVVELFILNGVFSITTATSALEFTAYDAASEDCEPMTIETFEGEVVPDRQCPAVTAQLFRRSAPLQPPAAV